MIHTENNIKIVTCHVQGHTCKGKHASECQVINGLTFIVHVKYNYKLSSYQNNRIHVKCKILKGD